MTILRPIKGLLFAGVAMAAGGCVAYPDGTVALLPPPPPVVVAPAPVVVASTPVVVTRPVYAYGGYRPYYRPYVWGGGYRGGYYRRGYYGRPGW